ncbi:MAG: chitobiase/beta-hexosaminidase C-terminal domain-containing protein [Candidatus Komeilibacteria bacterium]|nr:chitobiase/beta-hexosaminidase C-terminal domain-containing protein [Candidatus Komeilibacteria bacterium]
MNNKFKILAFPAILFSLFVVSNLALASEVTGNLNTGLNANNGNVVEGVVIAPPTASPSTGTYASAQNVALSAAGASSMRYTLDNSTPSCASGQVYSESIEITSSKTLKAISCYATGQSSSVASYAYTIRIAVNNDEVEVLLNEETLSLPDGATYNSTPSLQVEQNISISAGANTVTLPDNTIITAVNGQNFDATAITASSPAAGTLSGLTTGTVMAGSLQWGIANLGLQFSNPITISITVGNGLNGQTLSIVRSTSGNSGWTSDGIVSPATCVVSGGLCNFSATKASYYSAFYTPTPTPVNNGGGGGGGGGINSTPISNTPIVTAPIVTDPIVIAPIVNTPTIIPPQAVLGVKTYANGTLLRGSNAKIYVVENGKLKHITSLKELTKYAGQEIIKVSDEVITSYGQTVAGQAVLGVKVSSSIDDLIASTKFGQRGAKIKQLQTELQNLGFMPKNFKVTDYYGPITSRAVAKYQASK